MGWIFNPFTGKLDQTGAAASVTAPLTLSSGTITTSQPILDLSQTWNASGVTFTGLKFNATSTASASASLLLDLQVGGTSKFKVDKTGAGTFAGAVSGASYIAAGSYLQAGTGLALPSTSGWIQIGSDTTLTRDAANTLALRNTTNAQTFRVYNTYTDASNYERFAVTWSSDVAYARAQNAGTGSARLFVPVTGSTTVDALPAAATAGAGARSFVTDATATTYLSTVAGGGSNKVPVVSDGTNWLIG